MAGILDSIKDKMKEKAEGLGPFRAVKDATEALQKAGTPQDPQKAFEAKEKWLNRNNPYYRVDDTVKQVK